MLCEKCHTEMITLQEDNVGGMICPKCKWNIVPGPQKARIY